MKRGVQNIPSSDRGSALLAALCFCAVLGIALASYMGVCYQTLQTSTRNVSGTYSFEMAETGLEEALGALNRPGNDWSDWTLNNLSSPKTATKTLSGFSFGNGAAGTVSILIENYDHPPGTPDPVLRVTGSTTRSDGSVVTRKLQATAKLAPMFVNAVAATYAIPAGSEYPSNTYRGLRFSSGGVVDSTDSNPIVPAGEDEDAKLQREWFASFSAVVSSANGVELFNTQIKGYVAAASYRGNTAESNLLRLAYSGEGTTILGSVTPQMSTKIDQAHLSSSPYQPVFEIKRPLTGNLLPGGTATIGSSSDPTEMVYFVDQDLSVTAGTTIRVQGNVVLVVPGSFDISGSGPTAGQIVVEANSSLQIVVGGQSGVASTLRIAGGGIVNHTGRAKNVAVFFAGDSDSSPEIATTVPFCGVVYAPNCSFDFIVSSNLDFTGSIVAKTIAFTGTPSIHYDMDLRRPTTKFSCLETPFTVSSWQETSP